MNETVMLSRSEGHPLWENGFVLVGVFVICRSHKCSPDVAFIMNIRRARVCACGVPVGIGDRLRPDRAAAHDLWAKRSPNAGLESLSRRSC